MIGSIFHDVNILGTEYLESSKSLVFKALSNGIPKNIIFSDVWNFYLESFSPQNVLFDIVKLGKNGKTMDEALLLFPGISAKEIEYSKNNHQCIYILEPSCGLTGYIIAKEVFITD